MIRALICAIFGHDTEKYPDYLNGRICECNRCGYEVAWVPKRGWLRK